MVTYSSGSGVGGGIVLVALVLFLLFAWLEVLGLLELHPSQLNVLLEVLEHGDCTLRLVVAVVGLSEQVLGLDAELVGRVPVLAALEVLLSGSEVLQVGLVNAEDG